MTQRHPFPGHCPDGAPRGLSRRHLLQIGSLGLMGVSLPRLLESRAAAEPTAESALPKPRADAAILLFLNGGPSHLDMWDMKPEAAEGIRGTFKPVATSLPGYMMSEHLSRLAKHAHRATVVRSMHHSVNNSHAAAVYCSITGHDRGEVGGGTLPTDHPTPGAVVSMFRPPQAAVVPHVCLPYITKEGAAGPPQPGFFGGFMGRAHDPLFVLKDPNAADFSVPELSLTGDISAERLSVRRSLFAELDRRVDAHYSQSATAMTACQSQALDLLTSEATQQAFRISDESAKVREAYGRNIYGQSVLLARRLIEAGTRLVTISWAPDANATWDTHGSNFAKLKDTLLPQLDMAASQLISDLADRGRLDRTLVAIFGDFGRTPKINNNNGGRDHWNFCYSLMLVGGGFKQGLIYGASDKTGAFPGSNPLIPGDIAATIYQALGVRPDTELRDRLDRPHRLIPNGEVVPQLLS